MVDLRTQYEKIKTQIDNAVLGVLQSSAFINGPDVAKFTEEMKNYLKVKHVIPCGNGTDAIKIALMSLGLKPGDEVITPSFTYVATAESICLLGYKPVFVEVDEHTFTLSSQAFEKAITPKTKALIAVHLYGLCAHLEPIMEIAKKNNITVIEDTAQALGTDYIFNNGRKQKAGTIGHIGTSSFFPSKNLGCYGDGGMICTNDLTLAKRLKMTSNHGQSQKYVHDLIGVNSRLDTMQAAILRIKLAHLDNYISARNKVAEYYDTAFKNNDALIIPFRPAYSSHGFHQYTLTVKSRRDELVKYLSDKKIPTVVYYPIPLHLQKAYQQYGYKKGDFPATEKLCDTILSLPMHTELDEEQLKYIVEVVAQYLRL